MEILKPSQITLKKVISILKTGGVVICPTDTVYGFLADAGNKKAVAKIYKIKKRPKSKPLSLFVATVKMANEIAQIDVPQKKLLKKYWPGKVTVVLKRKADVTLYGLKKDSVAVRIPHYAFLQKLLKKINRPLVQTSVNISAEEPLNNIQEIQHTFKKYRNLLIIDGGNLKNAKPSKIIDLTAKKKVLLRK